jgi:hypothetical protein
MKKQLLICDICGKTYDEYSKGFIVSIKPNKPSIYIKIEFENKPTYYISNNDFYDNKVHIEDICHACLCDMMKDYIADYPDLRE